MRPGCRPRGASGLQGGAGSGRVSSFGWAVGCIGGAVLLPTRLSCHSVLAVAGRRVGRGQRPDAAGDECGDTEENGDDNQGA